MWSTDRYETSGIQSIMTSRMGGTRREFTSVMADNLGDAKKYMKNYYESFDPCHHVRAQRLHSFTRQAEKPQIRRVYTFEAVRKSENCI